MNEDLRKEYQHDYYIYNIDDIRKQQSDYKQTEGGREAIKRASKNYRLKLLTKALNKYSKGEPKCNCCRETNTDFLSLDGNASVSFLKKLENLDYPEGNEILCMNCDWGISQNHGMCPHKIVEVEV